MASPGHQHCASCISTLSFSIGPFHFQARCRKRRVSLALVFCVVVYFAMDTCSIFVLFDLAFSVVSQEFSWEELL